MTLKVYILFILAQKKKPTQSVALFYQLMEINHLMNISKQYVETCSFKMCYFRIFFSLIRFCYILLFLNTFTRFYLSSYYYTAIETFSL